MHGHGLRIWKPEEDPRCALLSDRSSSTPTGRCSAGFEFKKKKKLKENIANGMTVQMMKLLFATDDKFRWRYTLNEKLLKEYLTDSDGSPNSSMLPHSSPC
jgi:hypothetical protein